MKQIAITEIAGINIGQAENAHGATGVTVIMCPEGMAAGIDVRGGGPASRDTRTLDPLAAAEKIHAVVLSGGSAFGLDAAGGVMRYLEERGIGFAVGDVIVPLVAQSGIFDLAVGDATVRPDAAMGYAACEASERGNYRDGNFGVGCGATVGKLLGMGYCMKTGVGSAAVQVDDVQVGALMVANALGDIYDPQTGSKIAGVLSEDKAHLRDTDEALQIAFGMQADEDARVSRQDIEPIAQSSTSAPVANTCIGAVVTNANLSKAQLCKVAAMAHDGLARAVHPVHTSMDGDSIYGLSVGGVDVPLDLVGTLAAQVVAQAMVAAVQSARSAYGFPCASELEDKRS